MILRCSYEELSALRSGASTLLGEEVPSASPVVAPSVQRELVEALVPRLIGDMSVATLAELRAIEQATGVVVSFLREEMESRVAAAHPAAEDAVAAYFDFAHALSVLERLRDLGAEMEAMIEVVTGAAPTETAALTFQFPD